MKMVGLGISGLCLLLAGCGGAGESVTATPPPPPPPAATPFPLKASASFQTITGALAYNGTIGDGISTASNATFNALSTAGRSDAVTFGYDAASGTYTMQGNGTSASFGQANLTVGTDYSDSYGKTDGAVSDLVKLYGNARGDAGGTPPVLLSYTSYGVWNHLDSAASLTTRTYFLYGQPTGASSMPTTGTATYQMTVAANFLGVGAAAPQEGHLAGTATLNANFGTGAIDTVLTFTQGFIGGSYSGSGQITGDQFAGTFTGSTGTTGAGTFTDGKLNGGFFGPGAKEAGYTFQLHLHVADPYAGAAPQHLDTYIAGAAVGPKG